MPPVNVPASASDGQCTPWTWLAAPVIAIGRHSVPASHGRPRRAATIAAAPHAAVVLIE
jgi:hypothetical protein